MLRPGCEIVSVIVPRELRRSNPRHAFSCLERIRFDREQRAKEARVTEGGARAKERARATTGGPATVLRAATESGPCAAECVAIWVPSGKVGYAFGAFSR